MAKTTIRKAQGGVPPGGSTSQGLVKASNTDFDEIWGAVGSGGTLGGPGKLFLQTTPFTSSGTGANLVASFIVPGGTLGTNGAIKIKIPAIDVPAAATAVASFVIKYGGSTVATLNASSNISSRSFLEVVLAADGATGAQRGNGYQVSGQVASPSSGSGAIGEAVDYTVITVDSTADQTLEIYGTVAASTFTVHTIVAEIVGGGSLSNYTVNADETISSWWTMEIPMLGSISTTQNVIAGIGVTGAYGYREYTASHTSGALNSANFTSAGVRAKFRASIQSIPNSGTNFMSIQLGTVDNSSATVNGCGLRAEGGVFYFISASGGTVQSTSLTALSIDPTIFHLYAFVSNSAGSYLYVDGVLKASHTTHFPTSFPNSEFNITTDVANTFKLSSVAVSIKL